MTLRGYDRWRAALALLGVLVSGYLTLLHYDTEIPLVCSSGSLVNCEQVLTSPSSMVLGIPVAAFGMAWFLVALGLAWGSLRPRPGLEPPGLRTSALAWTGLGTASVLWLIYQELGVVGKVCVWCTIVHLLVLALLVLQVLSDPPRTGHGQGSA